VSPRERLLDGSSGPVGRADIRAERPREVERLAAVDAQLAALGFSPLGDLVFEIHADVLGRGYAAKTGDTWGGLFFGQIESSFDFVTHWASATLLTTLNGRGTGDEPKKGLYVSRLPNIGFSRLADLLARHAERRDDLSKKLGPPMPVDPTLRAFAEAVDRGIARQLLSP
jgi:hypothetical protein